MKITKQTYSLIFAVLLLPMAVHATPIVTSVGGNNYQISFDPISFEVTTSGQVASIVFEDFYSSTWTVNDGTYISGTAQASLNGGAVQNLIGNSNTGHYDFLNTVDGNDLLVTIFSGFVNVFGTVSVGDVLTISTIDYIFSSENGFNPAANTGPFDAFLVNNNFARVSNSGTEESVPAPATLALFGLGLAGLGWSRRKKA